MNFKKDFDNEILVKSFELVVSNFVQKEEEYVNKFENLLFDKNSSENLENETKDAEINILDPKEKNQEELDLEYEKQKEEFYQEQQKYQQEYEKTLENQEESIKKQKSKKNRRSKRKKQKDDIEEQVLKTPETLKFPFPIETIEDESMRNMLISWYYSGYYTGYYEAEKRLKKE